MTIIEAETILHTVEMNLQLLDAELIEQAQSVLVQSPYVLYECSFCEILTSTRKHTATEKRRLCTKCYKRFC